MKIIEPSAELINAPDYKTLLTTIEAAERTSGNLTSWDKVRNGCYGLNGEAGECIDILETEAV